VNKAYIMFEDITGYICYRQDRDIKDHIIKLICVTIEESF
jgi:hypothetical protein